MKLSYRKYGSGKPLVILHGLFGSSDNWQTLGKKFAEEYEVYLVDQRNHGHSPWSEDISYDLMANDLYELLEELDLKNIHLIGHSMGGKTVMTYGQKHPERLSKLIIVDIGPKSYPSHHDLILKGLNTIDLNIVKSRREADAIISQYIDNIGVKQFLLKNLYWKEKGKLAWRINIPVLTKEMFKILAAVSNQEIMIPTLFIRGEKSGYIVKSDYASIEKQFVNSRIETISNVGHWIHAENPSEFYRLVNEFVSL